MHYSIYNDNKISTSKFMINNLLKSSHFPSCVRTPPNKYKNYFIGELVHRVEPRFDSKEIDFPSDLPKSKTLNNFRYKTSNKISFKKYKCKSNKKNNFPKLIKRTFNNRSINGWTNTKNIKLVKNNTNENDHNFYDLYIKDLDFPYCKPKYHNPFIINYRMLLSNKNKNFKTIQNSRRKRTFYKYFNKLHLLMDKANNEKKDNE